MNNPAVILRISTSSVSSANSRPSQDGPDRSASCRSPLGEQMVADGDHAAPADEPVQPV
jgi:hypothetical protein